MYEVAHCLEVVERTLGEDHIKIAGTTLRFNRSLKHQTARPVFAFKALH